MDATTPYRTSGLWARLEAGLLAAGKDPATATYADFKDVEHFHTGTARATEELFTFLGDVMPARVLDIGGGLGGPARYLATKTGATVVVADPAEDFCAAGLRLSRLAGLTGRVGFVRGDGTSLPFRTGRFDLVWMQQAGMNIRDKRALLSEVSRVLAPGGRFLFQEVMAGPRPGPIFLPVPWAVTQDDNHLVPPETIRSLCESLGLSELFLADATAELAMTTRNRLEAMRSQGLPPLGVHLLSAGDPLVTPANTLRNVEDGRICFTRGGFTKTGD
jgi:SAM-dependent methyltransferase